MRIPNELGSITPSQEWSTLPIGIVAPFYAEIMLRPGHLWSIVWFSTVWGEYPWTLMMFWLKLTYLKCTITGQSLFIDTSNDFTAPVFISRRIILRPWNSHGSNNMISQHPRWMMRSVGLSTQTHSPSGPFPSNTAGVRSRGPRPFPTCWFVGFLSGNLLPLTILRFSRQLYVRLAATSTSQHQKHSPVPIKPMRILPRDLV